MDIGPDVVRLRLTSKLCKSPLLFTFGCFPHSYFMYSPIISPSLALASSSTAQAHMRPAKCILCAYKAVITEPRKPPRVPPTPTKARHFRRPRGGFGSAYSRA